MNAVEILREKERLTNHCYIDCKLCRLHHTNNDHRDNCQDLLRYNPTKYAQIVMQWSKECPELDMGFVELMQEKERLTQNCTIDCRECRLNEYYNESNMDCEKLMFALPDRFIEIMQQWIEDCPKRTCKDVFLEAFPNAKMSEKGAPSCCLHELGIVEVIECSKFNSCLECWNQKAK